MIRNNKKGQEIKISIFKNKVARSSEKLIFLYVACGKVLKWWALPIYVILKC